MLHGDTMYRGEKVYPGETVPAPHSTTGVASDRVRPWTTWLPALVLAALLIPISNGRWGVPVAAWLAPLFALHYVRSVRPGIGLLTLYLLFLAAFPLQWASMIPLEGWSLWLLAAGYQLAFLLPYALDRCLVSRVRGFTATLIFPLAWTSLELIAARTSPYATWGSLAYTQQGNLPLLQLLSLTGLAGVTFLVSWFAAVGSWSWQRAGQPAIALRGILTYGLVVGVVLLWGGSRLEFHRAVGETQRVASLTVEQGNARRIWNVRREGAKPAAIEAVRQATRALHNTLLDRSAEEARAGARLVFWAELNGLVLAEDEAELIQRGCALAQREQIYLGMALGTFTAGEYLMQNKLVVAAPNGEVVAEYFKARPVPGDPETGGSAEVPTIETDWGKLALAICYDLDFPGLIRQAGSAGADLLIVPARDSAALNPFHTRMAQFRAIENGFSLVRQTDEGLSVATDAFGRVTAVMDHFSTPDRVLLAQVPTAGFATLYSGIGDVFGWLCLVGLGCLSAVGLLADRAAKLGSFTT